MMSLMSEGFHTTILAKTFDVIEAEDGRQAIDMAIAQKPDVNSEWISWCREDGWADSLSRDQERPRPPRQIPVVMVTAIGFWTEPLNSVNKWAPQAMWPNRFPRRIWSVKLQKSWPNRPVVSMSEQL